MPDVTEKPTLLEIKNSSKVLEYLSDIEDISFKNIREDIFEVSNLDTGLTCIVDVEESIVCLQMDVCVVPSDNRERYPLIENLLRKNADAVHGKFCAAKEKILYKDNLEIENLDKNELEASLSWMFAMVHNSIEEIASIVDAGEREEKSND